MNLISRIEITRYGNRNWAVWLDGDLLAVTVYKKGAQAVAHALIRLTTQAGKEVHHVILAA
jgi:hypothetical protein